MRSMTIERKGISREYIQLTREKTKDASLLELKQLFDKSSLDYIQKQKIAELMIFLSIATRNRFINNIHNVTINKAIVEQFLFLVGFPRGSETKNIADNLVNISNIEGINKASFVEFFTGVLTIPKHVQTFINEILKIKFDISKNSKSIEYIFKTKLTESMCVDYLLLFILFNKRLNLTFTVQLVHYARNDLDLEQDSLLVKELESIKNFFPHDVIFAKFLLNIIEYNLGLSRCFPLVHAFKNIFNSHDQLLLINKSIVINKDTDKIINPQLAYNLFSTYISNSKIKNDVNDLILLASRLITAFSATNKNGKTYEAGLAFEALILIKDHLLQQNKFNDFTNFNGLITDLINNCVSNSKYSANEIHGIISDLEIVFKVIKYFNNELTNIDIVQTSLIKIASNLSDIYNVFKLSQCKSLSTNVMTFYKEKFPDN